ncbi:MAG: pyroglutamyl-peptidase I [Pirellulaceae bacterium]|nr:pyroglutamyl-peptidase I [Pirellulaceae bacterium]
MSQVLVTAFESYDSWKANSSWLTLVELTKNLPERPHLTTRRYPVDYEPMQQQLRKDLQLGFDYILHLGQSPGSCSIQLETIGLNQATQRSGTQNGCAPVTEDGPMAYRSQLPAEELCRLLNQAGIPSRVSTHAGTYLCNAALYYSHHIIATKQLKTQAIFLHLPLDVTQAAEHPNEIASMPASLCAQAIRLVLEYLAAQSHAEAS